MKFFSTLLTVIIAFSFSSLADEKKKIVFLADGGKNSKTHAHESGNALLAKALEESGLGFETSLHKGWPSDAKVFEGADCVVIFCNGGDRGASNTPETMGFANNERVRFEYGIGGTDKMNSSSWILHGYFERQKKLLGI
mgnify:CR=1 FL=1